MKLPNELHRFIYRVTPTSSTCFIYFVRKDDATDHRGFSNHIQKVIDLELENFEGFKKRPNDWSELEPLSFDHLGHVRAVEDAE